MRSKCLLVTVLRLPAWPVRWAVLVMVVRVVVVVVVVFRSVCIRV